MGKSTPGKIKPVGTATAPLMNLAERETQVGGSHYKDHQIQPWDIILDYHLDYWEGNAVKYILRTKTNRLEDLQKAKHYIEECIRQFKAVNP